MKFHKISFVSLILLANVSFAKESIDFSKRESSRVNFSSSEIVRSVSSNSESLRSQFAPNHINHLQLWLDASDPSTYVLSGSSVTIWIDKSDNHLVFSQATVAKMPYIQRGKLNGRDVFQFDGGQTLTNSSALPALGARGLDGFSFFGVAIDTYPNHCENSTQHLIANWRPGFNAKVWDISRTAFGSKFGEISSAGTTTTYITDIPTLSCGDSSTFDPFYDTFSVYIVTYSATNGSIGATFNGMHGTTAFSSTLFKATNVIGIGSGFGTLEYWTGEMAKLIWYDRYLTPEEQNRVIHYLQERCRVQ